MKRKTPETEYTKKSRSRIRELIDEFCIGKQIVFSQKTGIPKGTVSHYVNGGNVPSDEYAKKIADAFHVNLLWLKGYDADKYGDGSLRSLKTTKEMNDSLREETDLMYEAILEDVGYWIEPSYKKNVYILSRFSDGTKRSRKSVEIGSDDLRFFNDELAKHAELLAMKIFESNKTFATKESSRMDDFDESMSSYRKAAHYRTDVDVDESQVSKDIDMMEGGDSN